MPKDYKDAPAPRAESRLNHPLLLGMIIGLLLGIVISLAVALWLNRLSNPFVEKGKQQVEPITKLAPPQSQPPAEAAKAAEAAAKGKVPAPEKPAAKPGDRPRFEFYQILPGEKDAGDKDAKAAPKAPPAPAAQTPSGASSAAKPGSTPATAQALFGRDLLAAGRRLRRGARRGQPQGQDRLERAGGHGALRQHTGQGHPLPRAPGPLPEPRRREPNQGVAVPERSRRSDHPDDRRTQEAGRRTQEAMRNAPCHCAFSCRGLAATLSLAAGTVAAQTNYGIVDPGRSPPKAAARSR